MPATLLALLLGLVDPAAAWTEVRDLAPTVGFLIAVLVLAHRADRAGVFAYAGSLAARAGRGDPRRLLGIVFVLASAVTAVLSLDATVVLLTPVVLATTAALQIPAKPHVYACAHLANSASLLLPVSNLTNLLAMSAAGLSFLHFAGLMTLPWLAVIAVEFLILRRFFAADLTPPPVRQKPENLPLPGYAVGVLALTLAGFVIAGAFGVHPAWVAAAGALAMGRPDRGSLKAANLPFCVFVFGLGVVVLAVRESGFGEWVASIVPQDTGFAGLLLMALVAAALANVVNNLPATLMLLPFAADRPGLVLAILLGVNIGPNVTYAGSLATLLWRQILRTQKQPPRLAEFTRLGALTVPACLTAGVAGLWLALHF